MERCLLDLILNPDGSIMVLEDNHSTLQIVKDARDHERLEHAHTNYQFIKELIQQVECKLYSIAVQKYRASP